MFCRFLERVLRVDLFPYKLTDVSVMINIIKQGLHHHQENHQEISVCFAQIVGWTKKEDDIKKAKM